MIASTIRCVLSCEPTDNQTEQGAKACGCTALQVNVTAMVPTVVLGLLQHLAAHGLKMLKMKRLIIGGAAAPRSMIETLERWVGAEVGLAHGMPAHALAGGN